MTRTMMTMIKKCLLFSTLFIGNFITQAFAQHTDAGAWLNIGIKFDLVGDLSMEIAEEARYNISTADLYQLNSNFSLDYRLNKRFKVGADYRFSVRDMENISRVAASFGYREEINDLELALRSKIQYSFTPDESEGSAFRNKLRAKYKINKDFSPFVSAELFYSFSNKINQFDNYRIESGLSYGPNKHHDYNFSYLFDREFNVNNPDTRHIISLSYVYSF